MFGDEQPASWSVCPRPRAAKAADVALVDLRACDRSETEAASASVLKLTREMQANAHDSLEIKVINMIEDADLSMHWHGLHMVRAVSSETPTTED